MKIKAQQIIDWSKTPEAKSELPRLLRRLIHTVGSITAISVPAGASISQGGWDGEVTSKTGNAWVPKGKSVWELSCQQTATNKANTDYVKRTKATPASVRRKTTYIAVSAAKWTTSKKWEEGKTKLKEWKNVRAFGPDDIEQWLEEAPAIALQFAEELGLSGDGVQSPSYFWQTWACQSIEPISINAFFLDRETAQGDLIEKVKTDLGKSGGTFGIKSDSVNEGVAFTAASIMSVEELCPYTVVVTDINGWKVIEQNKNIKIAIAATPEIAEHPCARTDVVKIIPFASGDMEQHFTEVSEFADDPKIRVRRQDIYRFKEALILIGIEESDASRLAQSTGRSWSVLRRQRAKNPSIKTPKWLSHTAARSLSTVCLLGSWQAINEEDQKIVSRLASRSYEALEKDLLEIAKLDDSPILKIGNTWKAKSPLELLALFGSRITKSELDRFFEIAEELLSAPDPIFELPAEERYAAQIHGKVRPVSGFLFKSIIQSLVKLSVRGQDVRELRDLNIEYRVQSLVKTLLDEADQVRWLSLSSHLQPLAEAAPAIFLKAVEKSLSHRDKPVCGLIKETGDSGLFGGGCYHADLLWALETLAWAPERLLRVCRVLAELSKVEVAGNWGNTPYRTLLSIFRAWMPQTSASVVQRNEILEKLVKEFPETGFRLIDDILRTGNDHCSPNSRPKWRDDDAGSGYGSTPKEDNDVGIFSFNLMLQMSDGDPNRIAKLIRKIEILDPENSAKIFALVDGVINSDLLSEEEKELLREKLRERIYWHRNYSKLKKGELNKFLAPYEVAYKKLEPKSVTLRHKWLFETGWPDPPVKTNRARGKLDVISKLKAAATSELYAKLSWDEFTSFVFDSGDAFSFGHILSKEKLGRKEFKGWLLHKSTNISDRGPTRAFAGGFVAALDEDEALLFVKEMIDFASANKWPDARQVSLLTLLPCKRKTWEYVETLEASIQELFWKSCNASLWREGNQADQVYLITKLLDSNRPHTALSACYFNLKAIASDTIIRILEGIISGAELDTVRLDHHSITEAIDTLEEKSRMDRTKLMQLEFALFGVFGYDGKDHAKSLYLKAMTDPAIFTELVCMIYRKKGEKNTEPSKTEKSNAETAWRILHHCHHQPGADIDGKVTSGSFLSFVNEARMLCKKEGRLEVCDAILGEIMAKCGEDSDGLWPLSAARDILDHPDAEKLRHGFQIGTFNKRGVTSRAMGDGGIQERDMAEKYHRYAKAFHNSHPYLSATITEVAKSYEKDGLREDIRANLRREAY